MKDKTFLITRPKHEPTTSYLHYWSQRLIESAEAKGAKVLDISDVKAVRKEFEGRVKKMIPDYLHLNGHGTSQTVMGHDNKVILDTKNSKMLKNKITYALSCDSAAGLGPQAVKDGAKAYVGYDKEFYFATNNHANTHPLDDESAAFFLEPAMKFSEEILKGKSVDVAAEKTKQAFDESILKAANSEVQTGYAGYVKYLLWDKHYLAVYGKGKAAA